MGGINFVNDLTHSIFNYCISIGWLWTNYKKFRVSSIYDIIFRLNNVGNGNTGFQKEGKIYRFVIYDSVCIFTNRSYSKFYISLEGDYY